MEMLSSSRGDDMLHWREVSKTVAMNRRVKHLTNCDALLDLQNSITYSYFTYCVEMWGNTYKTNVFSWLAKQKKLL